MKSCKIIDGKLRCLEDDILGVSRKGQGLLKPPTSMTAVGFDLLFSKVSGIDKKQSPLKPPTSSGIDVIYIYLF